MTIINKTTDYTIFKRMDGNRGIDQHHLKYLKKAIAEDNQLSIHPIIVNKDYSVIDGQHRLEAAKELGLEIYYIKSDTVSDNHLIQANVNQKSWELANFIECYAEKDKNPEYIKLKELLHATHLQPKALLTLLLGNVSLPILSFIKTGRFRFPTNENPLEIVDAFQTFMAFTKDRRIKPSGMFTNYNFTRAFRWLYKTTGFDEGILLKKLEMKWFELKPQPSAFLYYELLLSIYNFKNTQKLEIEHGKTTQE